MSRLFSRSPDGNIRRNQNARETLTISADHIDRRIEGNTPINVVIVPTPRYVPPYPISGSQAEKRKERDSRLRVRAGNVERMGVHPSGFPIIEYVLAQGGKGVSNVVFRKFVNAEIRARKEKGLAGGEMFSLYKPTVRQRRGSGGQKFTISSVGEGIKASEHFHNCIGGLVKARSRDGKILSFGWHVNWLQLLYAGTKEFTDAIHSALDELLRKDIVPGTIDAVLFGGRYRYDEHEGAELASKRNKEEYVDAIHAIAEILRSKLNFEPRVAVGPDRARESTTMYFDGQSTLYLFMPAQEGPQNVSFLPDKLEALAPQWDAEPAPRQRPGGGRT